MALIACHFCNGEHAAGTARCPVTGALLRRPKGAPAPPEPEPEPEPATSPSPATYEDAPAPAAECTAPEGGGPDPHAALFAAPSSRTVTAAPTALRVLPDGPVVPLTPGRVVPLGREASPIAHVCSDNVSRRHAEVRVEPDRLVVVDVGSVNGTFVNDRQIPTGVAHPVVAGDTLRLGSDPALRLSFTSLP